MSQNELVIEDKTHANNGRNDRERVIITMCPPSKLTEKPAFEGWHTVQPEGRGADGVKRGKWTRRRKRKQTEQY